MSHKRLLIIGGAEALISLLDRANRLGISTVVVQKRELVKDELFQMAERVIVLDYENDPLLEPIAQAIHRTHPVDRVISLTEYGLMPAAKLSVALGLPAVPPEVVEKTRDKHAMRRALAAAGFDTVKAELGRTVEDLLRFREKVGSSRFIIKPRDGVGSQLVYCVEEKTNLAETVAMFNGDFLMEEFLEGRELSLESYSFNGKHFVFGINEETKYFENSANPYVEIAHEMPALLSEQEKAEVVKYLGSFLDCIGISDGPAHTELKLTPQGPRLIETHNRLGGDWLPILVRLSCGFDLYECAVGWPTRVIEPPVQAPTPFGGAAIRYFTPPPGVVKKVSGVEYARLEPGVVTLNLPLRPGSVVRTVQKSLDRSGYVIATAATAKEAAKICQRVVDMVRIEMQQKA
ncbi:ATP-grasp domain-containing protein [Cystobacter fuscus]|uniref:ATP-grasp domain-containing protein n=1 Tax=Cystobacter fuscus TaxID=43 RepID=UPI002B2917C3|nr:ATP-grasp domain-containing protein [Cystobacter fuscus]